MLDRISSPRHPRVQLRATGAWRGGQRATGGPLNAARFWSRAPEHSTTQNVKRKRENNAVTSRDRENRSNAKHIFLNFTVTASLVCSVLKLFLVGDTDSANCRVGGGTRWGKADFRRQIPRAQQSLKRGKIEPRYNSAGNRLL
jgi:hypothetical protein